MNEPNPDVALVLGCDPPGHASHRTRLESALGSRLACLIEWSMFECALEDLFSWRGPRFIAVSDVHAPWAEEIAGGLATVLALPKRAADECLGLLAERLGALRQEKWLLISRPVPTISPLCLAVAAAALGRGETAIGPAADGQPALLGLAADPQLVAQLDLGRSSASSRVARRLHRAGFRVAFVNPGPGIDCLADIDICHRELDQDDRPARARLRFLLGAVGSGVSDDRAWLRTLRTEQCPTSAAPAYWQRQFA